MGLPILEHLREQTRPAHLALEAQPSLEILMSNELTRARYSQLMQSMLAFYQALESELVPAADAVLLQYPARQYQYRPRARVLADDVRALGCDTGQKSSATAGFRPDKNEGFLIGVLYVIEGSTQGGRLIAKHLEERLDISDHSGAGFFNMGRQYNSWRAFRRWLGNELPCNDPVYINNAVEGANMTFTALHSHLDQWQPSTHGN